MKIGRSADLWCKFGAVYYGQQPWVSSNTSTMPGSKSNQKGCRQANMMVFLWLKTQGNLPEEGKAAEAWRFYSASYWRGLMTVVLYYHRITWRKLSSWNYEDCCHLNKNTAIYQDSKFLFPNMKRKRSNRTWKYWTCKSSDKYSDIVEKRPLHGTRSLQAVIFAGLWGIELLKKKCQLEIIFASTTETVNFCVIYTCNANPVS